MRRPLTMLLVLLVPAGLVLPAGAQSPTPGPTPVPPDATVLVEGAGAAHGMGLAMDGVQGQIGAGWSSERVLDLFYPGTEHGTFSGTVRVGLASSPDGLAFVLPGGGTVSRGGGADAVHVPAGGRIVVSKDGPGYRVELPGSVGAAQDDPPIPLPSSDPTPLPEASPSPTPAPEESQEATPAPEAEADTRHVWIDPDGSPAVTRVEATGRRYRGRMQVRASDRTGELWAVNHVDMETYVMGIAEEKGAGWPVEGLKVLAIAARSLAASTMTWYDKRHVDGHDICATSMCQVYLGLDGEFPEMREATRATRGQIRTWSGRPILAMYHGNGGGQTDSYSLIYTGGRSDPHPYLQAIEYPYARPKRWRFAYTPTDVTRRLAERGVAVPGTFTDVEILETGRSPRVRRLRVLGTEGSVETTGMAFQAALELPSSWFRVGETDDPVAVFQPPTVEGAVPIAGLDLALPAGTETVAAEPAPSSSPDGRSWRWAALAALMAAVAAAAASLRRLG